MAAVFQFYQDLLRSTQNDSSIVHLEKGRKLELYHLLFPSDGGINFFWLSDQEHMRAGLKREKKRHVFGSVGGPGEVI